MRFNGWTAVAISALFLSGCATTSGRNYQTDIDALNARVTALQGQLAEKDEQISSLKNKVDDERMAREAAETTLRNTPPPAPAKKPTVTDFK